MRPEGTRAAPEPVPPEPWRSFLGELDGLLTGSVELRCLGGFVVTQQYGIGRETSDIDFLSVIAQSPDDNIEKLAGLGTAYIANTVCICSTLELLHRRRSTQAD